MDVDRTWIVGEGKAARMASCGPSARIIGNTTIEDGGLALKYSVTHCPQGRRTQARDDWETPQTLDKRKIGERENLVLHMDRGNHMAGIENRQTCTECPCANGSIQCFCSDLVIPGQNGESLFIDTCLNSTPPATKIPITADCTKLASLMVTGAPADPDPNFPIQTNGYYNIPSRAILSWEFQDCGFAFFNDLSSEYNICAKDLAHAFSAFAAYCTDVNTIEGQFQNDPFKSLLVFHPRNLH
ncbi:hypothetical protein B0H19DRAFT_1082458 [Mycena capillaripes]|nr:hypothetical protein B0H19DRAFT_1082458 [Mycena capillaripes]